MAEPTTRPPGRGLRLFGIEIRVQASWLVFALLIAWSLATGAFPQLYAGLPTGSYWLMAVIVVVGLAVSVVLHEMAHSLVGRAMGLSVERISLFLFGGVAELKGEPKSARAELLMAIAGPAFSFLLAWVFLLLGGVAAAQHAPAELHGSLNYLAMLNLVLAVFNLAPAFPMDGGRVFRAILWMATKDADRATHIAAQVSTFVAYGLIGAGVFMAISGHVSAGIWWVLMGLFLRFAGQSSTFDVRARRVLQGFTVAQVMDPGVEALPADTTLEDFAARRLYSGHHGMYAVASGGALVGVIEAANVLGVPRAAWERTTLGQVCAPLDRAPVAWAGDDAHALMTRMLQQNRSQYFVSDGGALVGAVTLRDLMERLELAAPFERLAPSR